MRGGDEWHLELAKFHLAAYDILRSNTSLQVKSIYMSNIGRQLDTITLPLNATPSVFGSKELLIQGSYKHEVGSQEILSKSLLSFLHNKLQYEPEYKDMKYIIQAESTAIKDLCKPNGTHAPDAATNLMTTIITKFAAHKTTVTKRTRPDGTFPTYLYELPKGNRFLEACPDLQASSLTLGMLAATTNSKPKLKTSPPSSKTSSPTTASGVDHNTVGYQQGSDWALVYLKKQPKNYIGLATGLAAHIQTKLPVFKVENNVIASPIALSKAGMTWTSPRTDKHGFVNGPEFGMFMFFRELLGFKNKPHTLRVMPPEFQLAQTFFLTAPYTINVTPK